MSAGFGFLLWVKVTDYVLRVIGHALRVTG